MYNILWFLCLFVNFYFSFGQIPQHNSTYIDRSDNVLRVPSVVYDDPKSKKKNKKAPKSTIQKIIKRNRMKIKKLYVHQMTAPTSQPKSMTFQVESRQKDEQTTQANRRRQKKQNIKIVRNRMPFHNLQRSRFRRSLERNDLYVLKDLDEVEFLASDNESVVVNAHVKNYW